MIKKGTWVRIKRTILPANKRSSALPEATKKVPLEMWVKGFLETDAKIGDWVRIKTIINRQEEGYLVEANPAYKHNYGDFLEEILKIDQIINKALWGDIYE